MRLGRSGGADNDWCGGGDRPFRRGPGKAVRALSMPRRPVIALIRLATTLALVLAIAATVSEPSRADTTSTAATQTTATQTVTQSATTITRPATTDTVTETRTTTAPAATTSVNQT